MKNGGNSMSRLPGNKYRSDPHAMGIPAGGILLTNQDEPPRHL